MISWLGADSPGADRGTAFVDYIGLSVPLGVVVAALIAAGVALRTARKLPYDRLESLVSIRSEWPDDLEGRDTIDRDIARQLAKLRLDAGEGDRAEATARELAAERSIQTDWFPIRIGLYAAALALIIIVGITLEQSEIIDPLRHQWLILGPMFATIGLMLGDFTGQLLGMVRRAERRASGVDVSRRGGTPPSPPRQPRNSP